MFDADTLDHGAPDTTERRRAGRNGVASGLLPLLRGSAGVTTDDDVWADRWRPRDPVSPPRGIGVALALCTPIWLGFGGLLYALTR